MEETPETDHLLQLRLRAGEPTFTGRVLRSHRDEQGVLVIDEVDWSGAKQDSKLEELERLLRALQDGDWYVDEDDQCWQWGFDIDANLHRWFVTSQFEAERLYIGREIQGLRGAKWRMSRYAWGNGAYEWLGAAGPYVRLRDESPSFDPEPIVDRRIKQGCPACGGAWEWRDLFAELPARGMSCHICHGFGTGV